MSETRHKEFVGFVKVKEVQGQNGSWEYTQISFKADDLEKMKGFLNDSGYVNLKLNRSQKGKEYLEIDTWQPTYPPPVQESPVQEATPAPASQGFAAPPMDEEADDVPF